MSRITDALDRAALGVRTVARATHRAATPTRDHHPQFRARVVAVTNPTPAFRRVTLRAAGPGEFGDLRLTGPDEYVGLFLPRPGCALHLPADTGDLRRALAALPEEIRGDLRWYTIRAHRPETAEIDVDVVCTDHGGPGSRWIRGVAVGDEVGVWVGVALHVDAPGHHLLLADETGLPGLLAILEAARAHPDRTYTALVELPDEDHMPPELAEHDVRVVLRGSRAPGTALTPALEALDPGAAHLPPIDHAWICAEGGTVAACRARVLRGHHVPRRHVVSSGFWRLGRPRP